MRDYDAICPPPVREFSPADIKRLREGLKFSPPVFALHLHTSASSLRKHFRKKYGMPPSAYRKKQNHRS